MSLNQGQQSAVNAPGHCLIVACPGSGKTHTLVQRASRILRESQERRLSIVTFTRAAAEELKERLVRALGHGVLPRIEAGTFHSLCMKQLPALYGSFGVKGYAIANEGDTQAMMFNVWQATAKKFASARLTLDVVRKTIEFAKANDGLLPSSTHDEAMTFAMREYQSLLNAQKMMDFADIINYAVMGMQSGQIPPLPVKDLLVDEFQDADISQINWVLCHVALGVRVTCVGDDDQSIYGFRSGKGYAGMMQFAKASNATVITLDTTYRCAAPVIAHAARLIGHNKERVAKTIRTANTSSGSVERRDFRNFDEEIETACSELAGRAKGQTAAILGRTNNVLRAVEATLIESGIPYTGGLGGDFWSSGLPGIVHGLIGAIAGQRPAGATLALSARGMNSRSIHAAREQIQTANGRVETLFKNSSWLTKLTEDQAELWNEFRVEFANLLQLASGDRSAFARACTGFVEPGVGDYTTDRIIMVVQHTIAEMPGDLGDIYQRIERLRRAKNNREQSAPGKLTLLTLHASKGLEFDRVWMPALRQGVLPHTNADVDEERRLTYVGMTRARRFLTLSFSRVKDAPESIFLLEAGLPSADVVKRRSTSS